MEPEVKYSKVPSPADAKPQSRKTMWWIIAGMVLLAISVGGPIFYFGYLRYTFEPPPPEGMFPGLIELNKAKELIRSAQDKYEKGEKETATELANQGLKHVDAVLKEVGPKSTFGCNARLMQAIAMRILGDLDKSRTLLEEVTADCKTIRDDILTIDSIAEWAYVNAMQGKSEVGLKALRDAERASPANFVGHVSRISQARIHIHNKDYGKAIAIYERIIEKYQGPENSWLNEATARINHLKNRMPAEQLKAPANSKKVSGVLDGNRRWQRADGTYVVTASVRIPAGSRLDIDPGVTVLFAEGARLEVLGALGAKGMTGDGTIRFSRLGDRMGNFAWGGLDFHPSADAVELEHCLIEFAEFGVRCRAPAMKLTRCVVRACGSAGVQVIGRSEAASKPELLECTLEGNFGLGLECRGPGASPMLEKCTLTANDLGGAVALNSAAPSFVDCRIIGNGDDGVAFLKSAAGRLEKGTVIENNLGLGIRLDSRSNPTIDGAVVRSNAAGGVWINDSSPVFSAGTIDRNGGNGVSYSLGSGGKLLDTSVADNKGVGVVLHNGSGKPEIRGCRIRGHAIGVSVTEGSAFKLTGNDLSGNREAALENKTKNRIDVRENWWGSVDKAVITAAIKGPTAFEPFLSVPPASVN